MKEERRSQLARFLITCPDRPGIVAKVSTFLAQQNANITELDQHSDADEGTFFMRLEFQADFKGKESEWEEKFEKEIASAFQMDWKILYEKKIKKMAIFVSKYDHVLLEILWRHASQALRNSFYYL